MPLHIARCGALTCAALTYASIAHTLPAVEVAVERLPSGGVQPQIALDAQGGAHLVYLSGDPSASDVQYIVRTAGASQFTAPMRVNSTPGSAMAMGSVRGARIALGRNGRAHVLWNGIRQVWYSSSDAEGHFAPQRNMMQATSGIDGGSGIAADAAGHVIIAWHARMPETTVAGEGGRAVFVRISDDDGATFAREAPAWQEPTGACGCCSLALDCSVSGLVALLYRSAADMGSRRDMYLLTADLGAPFAGVDLHRWRINACPMSTAAIAHGAGRQIAAWETNAQIFISSIDQRSGAASPPLAVPGNGGARHHPSVAISPHGDVLVAWDEGTGWAKGGSVAWQHYAADGSPDGPPGKADGLPAWDVPAAYARPDGFGVIY